MTALITKSSAVARTSGRWRPCYLSVADMMYLAQRTKIGALLILPVLYSALSGSPVEGNVLPDAIFRMHVQESFISCEQNPLVTCWDVNRTTEAEGDLEFDLFVDPSYPEEIRSIEADLNWPSTWQVWGWEFCSGGIGEFDPYDGRLQISYPDPPSMTFGELFLVARFGVRVSGSGSLGTEGAGRVVCESGWNWYPIGIDAQAGVTCARCPEPCTYGPEVCLPEFSPAELALEAAPGAAVTGEILATVASSGCPEPPWEVEQPWLGLTAERVDPRTFRVSVSASAAGLEPGEYTSWIAASRASCRTCVRVRFTVLATASVPELPEKEVTWGTVKWVHR